MKKKGFTLLELLAVIVVLAVVVLIGIPVLLNVINKSKISALKDSAANLVDEANLYYMQYQPEKNLRFDINDGVVTSNDTEKLLSFKGSIEEGSLILTSYGKVAICVNDGDFSAYKNLQDREIAINEEKNCNIPEGNTIIYLEGTATIAELSNQELTTIVQELQTEVAELKKGANPIGTIIAVSHNSVPDGYLACNGQEVSRTEYAELYNLIGTTYGTGDGSTTFNLPDLRGEFLRGSGNNSHINSGDGGSVGEHQAATGINPGWVNNESGGFSLPVAPSSSYSSLIVDGGDKYVNTGTRKSISSTTYLKEVANTSSNSGYWTTRPTNTSVLYAIRVK